MKLQMKSGIKYIMFIIIGYMISGCTFRRIHQDVNFSKKIVNTGHDDFLEKSIKNLSKEVDTLIVQWDTNETSSLKRDYVSKE